MRIDNKMLFIFIGHARIVLRHHHLMQLFPLADADLLHLGVRQHRVYQIINMERRDFGNIGFSALALRQRLKNKLHALIQCNPEPRHPQIGHGQFFFAPLDHTAEQRNYRPAAARHIAVAHHGKGRAVLALIGICCDKKFVRDKLCTAVQIDRIHRFIRRKRYNLLHAAVKRGVNDILRPVNVGLDRFKRIIFTGRNLLHCRRMDHIIHSAECPIQPILVPHISNKKAHFRHIHSVLIIIFHDMLLKLVPGIDNDLLWMIALKNHFQEFFPK